MSSIDDPTSDEGAAGTQPFADLRFAFLSYTDVNLYRFRLPVMRRLAELGARVFAVAPPHLPDDRFAPHGIELVPIEMHGASVNPVQDLRTLPRLTPLLRDLRPDVLQTFMLKPNLIGGWIARRERGVRVVSTVTGLGRLYEDDPSRAERAIRWGAERLLRLAFSHVSSIVFQNPDDRAELLRRGLYQPGQERLIAGSGVDVDEYSPESVDPRRIEDLRARWGLDDGLPVVTMVARLLPSKGVREFAAAARALRGRARFVLIGPLDEGARLGRSGITPQELEHWKRADALVVPGLQEDIPAWLGLSDVYALPSYYREGVPRSVLEGMAMGLPVVTTTMPGCKETVEEGSNGFLVPPRDASGLVEALDALIEDPGLRDRMGKASRALAERRFSSEAVVGQHLALYRELLATQP